MRAYIDSDILIWHLHGKPKARDFIRRIQKTDEFELWTGAMQRAEIIFFMCPGEEEATELFLSLFQTAPVDQAIIDTAGGLYRKWLQAMVLISMMLYWPLQRCIIPARSLR